jgi:hypothetical protein
VGLKGLLVTSFLYFFGLSPLTLPSGEIASKTSPGIIHGLAIASDVVQKTSLARCNLWRGFLNPCSTIVAQPSPEGMD